MTRKASAVTEMPTVGETATAPKRRGRPAAPVDVKAVKAEVKTLTAELKVLTKQRKDLEKNHVAALKVIDRTGNDVTKRLAAAQAKLA